MGSNPALVVSLGFTIYLVAVLMTTYCPGFSNAFIPLKSQPAKDGLTAGWEQMEETFVASSTGEGMEVIDMVQHEDSLRSSAVMDLPLNLALSTGSIVLFLLCVT